LVATSYHGSRKHNEGVGTEQQMRSKSPSSSKIYAPFNFRIFVPELKKQEELRLFLAEDN
jgi:hypothetical protein